MTKKTITAVVTAALGSLMALCAGSIVPPASPGHALLSNAEKDNRREVITMPGLLPHDPENFRAEVLRSSGPLRPAPKIAIDTVVGGRVSGQEPGFPLQIHTFPNRLQAHALLM